MGILLFVSVFFVLFFLLLFWFFQHANKKEDKKDSFLVLLAMSIFFSLVLTLVVAFFLFLIIGSTSVLDRVFSLNITNKQLVVIGITYFLYCFTLDNFFEFLFDYLFGKSIYALGYLTLSRMAAFYIIGILINLNNEINTVISIGLSLIFLVVNLIDLEKIKTK